MKYASVDGEMLAASLRVSGRGSSPGRGLLDDGHRANDILAHCQELPEHVSPIKLALAQQAIQHLAFREQSLEEGRETLEWELRSDIGMVSDTGAPR